MSEQNFEYRIQHLLEKKGYLVINCARSRPFDLVAFNRKHGYLIEVKGKTTVIKHEQLERQGKLACETPPNVTNVLIQQSKKRGKFTIAGDNLLSLTRDLKEYLV